MIHTGLVLALLSLSFLLPDVAGDEHSLCYLYTIQSKSSTDRIYEFSAVTLLDDRQIDFYNSTKETRTAKQDWMKDINEREWKDGTEKLKSDGQQLNKVLDNQMKAFKHNETDGHSLQWRIGCEGEKHSDGSVSGLNCINEYGYDGESLVSYNWTLKKWSASVGQDGVTEKWNTGRGQNPVQRCQECVEWLKIYLEYNTTETKQTQVNVYVFMKKSVTDLKKLTLTCLATGFYPKDVEIILRKSRTSLPEYLLASSGVRPNDDGTYQLRKSVEIQEEEAADYDCYVNHSSITEPVIKQWDGKCSDCQDGVIVRVIVGVTVGVVALLAVIIYFCIKKSKSRGGAGDVQAEPVNPQPDGGTSNDESDNGSEEKKPMLPGNSTDDQPKITNGQSCQVEEETCC
ncbi:H-2 class I histocompatibility antigen, alpha chain-like [Colossoma macropomum]|uniref:H-2 class I histocompatibility antigen, alpha chain-like n=1 Tax=Colossoma macropomum TaxID=42526 RepID=UPI001863C4C1|nr:H-2 class I histocompatibility antigen, alpha chain-like [Colossoma macropomum]